MGWTNPRGARPADRRRRPAGRVRGDRDAGSPTPMFQLSLFRIRAFTAGNIAGLLVSIARGGLQFMLIIWLQGIWLPLHGYSYSRHAAVGGHLPAAADARASCSPGRCRARCPTGSARAASPPPGWSCSAAASSACCCCRSTSRTGRSPCSSRPTGSAAACSPSPNSSSIMSSVPARHRGAASGMRSTFQNSGTALSIGVFFSLMIAGLASTLPTTLTSGLQPAGRAGRGGPPHRLAAAGVVAVRGGPRRQPAPAPAGGQRRASPAPGGQPARPDRPGVLPGPDRRRRSSTAWASCSAWRPAWPRWPPWRRCCAAAATSTPAPSRPGRPSSPHWPRPPSDPGSHASTDLAQAPAYPVRAAAPSGRAHRPV